MIHFLRSVSQAGADIFKLEILEVFTRRFKRSCRRQQSVSLDIPLLTHPAAPSKVCAEKMRRNHQPASKRTARQRLTHCGLISGALFSAVLNCHANPPDPSTASPSEATAPLPSPAVKVRNFSLQFGVANLTSRNIGEILSGDVDSAEGDASGQLYSLTFSWTAHRFSIPVGKRTLTPQFEPYLALTIVDEDNRSPFPDYNGGVGFRWVNFPWNDWLAVEGSGRFAWQLSTALNKAPEIEPQCVRRWRAVRLFAGS